MDESGIRLRAARAGLHEANEAMADAVRLAQSSGLTITQISDLLGEVGEEEVFRLLAGRSAPL